MLKLKSILKGCSLKFTQSRYQDFFSRGYESLCYLGYFIVFSLIASVLSIDISFASYIVTSVIFGIGTLIYITFMYKSGTKSLEISDEQIIYTDKEEVTEIDKADFEGYEVTKFMPHRIILNNRVYGKTQFSYYSFSKAQRQQIFELLDTNYSTNS